MLIKKETEYAVLGLIGLVNQGVDYADVKQVAKELNLSTTLLSKIFQKLAKAKIIESKFGPTGGFRLIKDPKEITFLEIMEAAQGKTKLMKCFGGQAPYCKDEKCYMRNIVCAIESDISKTLTKTTLENIIHQ